MSHTAFSHLHTEFLLHFLSILLHLGLWKVAWQYEGNYKQSEKKSSLECKELTFSTALEITTRCVAIRGRQFRLRQSSDLLISLFPRWIHPSSSSKHTDEKLFFLFRNAIFTKTERNSTHGACLKLNSFHPARRKISNIGHNLFFTKTELHISRKIRNKGIHSSLFFTSETMGQTGSYQQWRFLRDTFQIFAKMSLELWGATLFCGLTLCGCWMDIWWIVCVGISDRILEIWHFCSKQVKALAYDNKKGYRSLRTSGQIVPAQCTSSVYRKWSFKLENVRHKMLFWTTEKNN